MNIYTNEAYFTEQKSRAKRMQRFGVLAIILSFVCSIMFVNNIYLVLLAYPLLFIGLPLWSQGRALNRRLSQTPRADAAIEAELKGFSNKYTVHHFPIVGGKLIKHLLVTPNGLIVIESNEANGVVTCKSVKGEDRWGNKAGGWIERFAGLRQPVGNPSREIESAIGAARSLLTEIGKPDVPIEGLIVFTRRADIQSAGCTYSALPVDELKPTIKQIQYDLGSERSDVGLERLLTSEDRRKFNALLVPALRGAPVKTAAPARR